MTPTTPSQVIEAFAASLNSGDLQGALALYEPGAAFEPEPGRRVHGLAAIGEALTGFFAIEPRISGEIQKVIEAGDVALVVNRWSLRGTDPGGQPIEMGGVSSDVMRRQPDGTWKIAIDDPWGASSRA
jgi:uncharacterized protein (TIGR02246 family)